MEELQSIFESVHKELNEANMIREKILTLSRKSIQKSSIAIKHLHRGEFDNADNLIVENGELISQINELSTQMEPIRFGIILSCNQEYAESIFLQAFLEKRRFPNYHDLKIPYLAYLHGIVDFVGELRRVILDTLRQEEDIEIAVKSLDLMDEIYSLLISIDFPDSITFNLRKKIDFVRNLTEKTRGDVTLALNRIHLVKTFKDIVSHK